MATSIDWGKRAGSRRCSEKADRTRGGWRSAARGGCEARRSEHPRVAGRRAGRGRKGPGGRSECERLDRYFDGSDGLGAGFREGEVRASARWAVSTLDRDGHPRELLKGRRHKARKHPSRDRQPNSLDNARPAAGAQRAQDSRSDSRSGMADETGKPIGLGRTDCCVQRTQFTWRAKRRFSGHKHIADALNGCIWTPTER